MNLREKALSKAGNLDHRVLPIAISAINEAFDIGMTFTISEGRRSIERQYFLLSQGRSKSDIMANSFSGGFRLTGEEMKIMLDLYNKSKNLSGPIVTWTLRSKHVDGLALDIYPINTTHSELSILMLKYGITHPFLRDPPHYELTNAKMPSVKQKSINSVTKIKALRSRMDREKDPAKKSIIDKEIKILMSL